jgi:hypothetical protein
MNRCLFTVVTLCPFVVPSNARAEHADVRPRVENGRIVTSGYIDATSTELPDVRVFGYDFGEDPDQPFFTPDPGFNAAAGSGLPSGSQLLFNIVSADDLGLPANLSYWNGSGDVDFVVPTDETLTLNFGAQSRIADNSTNFVAGFNLQTVPDSGAVHRHLNAFLNGGGDDPAPGIYLVSLELQSSDANVQTSLPFFVVYNNGLSEDAHDLAITWVEENLVPIPEPSTFVLATIAIAAGILTWRSRCNR